MNPMRICIVVDDYCLSGVKYMVICVLDVCVKNSTECLSEKKDRPWAITQGNCLI